MTEHTPTPWILDGASFYYLDWDGESYEGRGKDYRQQLTNRFWCSMQGTQKRIPKKELEANAAFIVKAVNNHAALVKALEQIAEGTVDLCAPFRAMPREYMQCIASEALSQVIRPVERMP